MGRAVPSRIDSRLAVYKFWRLKCGNKLNLAPLGKHQPLDAATNAKLLDLLAETIAEMQKQLRQMGRRLGRHLTRWAAAGSISRSAVCDFKSGDQGGQFHRNAVRRQLEGRSGPSGAFHRQQRLDGAILMFFYKDGVRSFTCTPWGESADPHSPHYMDQGEKLYSKRQMKPTWWSKAELLKHVESKKVLEIPG